MKLVSERSKKVDIPKDEDGGYIMIRALSLEEIARIESKYMQVTSQEVRMVNYAERDGDFARACLTDWGNLFEESGVPLKFNPRNIEAASNLSIDIGDERVRFFDWINREREKFQEETETQEEAARKN